jgi:poly [ADP-ribose] polymerase 10/14/15
MKYTIDFASMKQINAKSGFARAIMRKQAELPSPPVSSDRSTLPPVPADLTEEMLLELHLGSIVQLSKQRQDGWAFGNVIYTEEEDTLPEIVSENVSRDAGWFPISCTKVASKEDLAKLQQRLGGAGADCLVPPQVWAPIKDPMIVELFSLSDGEERDNVVNAFKASLTAIKTLKVVKVERVQNLSLWQSYAVKKQTIFSRESGSDKQRLERKWLFHGTTSDTVPKIQQQGFNRSFCGKNATMYGKGVYFARDSSYSSSPTYSPPDINRVQHMFLCRVIVGEFCTGKKDAPAPDVRDVEKHLLYDSTVDNVRDPCIFVTYHDAQAYPEYIVHFTQ